jgi:hypothetical protein
MAPCREQPPRVATLPVVEHVPTPVRCFAIHQKLHSELRFVYNLLDVFIPLAVIG